MLTCQTRTTRILSRRSRGVALVIAVLVLTVLSSLLATLAVRITMVKRRQAFRVEYQRARYALDSAVKYALATIPNQTFSLIEREDVPDFSDLFVMNDEQYRMFLKAWAYTATDEQIEKVLKEDALSAAMETQDVSPEVSFWLADILGESFEGRTERPPVSQTIAYTDPNTGEFIVEIDLDDIEVPGPYGVPWPYVIDPIELQIGMARVTITIEDENAKMPLAWMVTSREEANKQAATALAIFGDWMGMSSDQRVALQDQLEAVYERKAFELNPSPILLPQQRAAPAAAGAARQPGQVTTTRTTAAQRRQAQRQARQQAQQPVAQPRERPAAAHSTDFAKLFHSSLLDREQLARPVTHTALPDQSPLKYLALWGSQRVNVNTAPRHVLEAALSFGSADPTELVEQIIQARRRRPFESIDKLKENFFSDSTAIERARDYLTTTSNFFLIRVVSHSGNARASAVATVIKEERNVERLAIMYGF